MKITVTLDEAEITTAIKKFITDQNVVTVESAIDVNLVASRGPAGHSAVISIDSKPGAEKVEEVVVKPAPSKKDKKTEPVVDDTAPPWDENAVAEAPADESTDSAEQPVEAEDLFGTPDSEEVKEAEKPINTVDVVETGITEGEEAASEEEINSLFA